MRDTIRIYKILWSFADPYARAPTQQDLKVAECVAAYSAGDVDKDARIDELDEQRRK